MEPQLITPRIFSDRRGYFSELYARRVLPTLDFVQDNVSLSAPAGTVRGLHFQAPPFAQAKLVMVLRGAIYDVAVDLRRGSPRFGRWFAAELTGERLEQILIPRGFAHGFCTLVPDTLVVYKVDNDYSAAHDGGILWNDPALGIPWPVAADAATVSDKDRALPLFRDIASPFSFEG
jgi:dTDP-4-dehydrorhamnose 3,5-epimerase